MKPYKGPGSTRGAARRLLSEKRSLLKEIERYLEQQDVLTESSVEGLRHMESLLAKDIEEIERNFIPAAQG